MLITELYNPSGETILKLETSEERGDHIKLTTPTGEITISWFQARDIYCDLNEWLQDSAHLASREN